MGHLSPRKLGRSLRFQILRRDNHQCRYCGAAAPEAKLTVDHVIPVALGGADEPQNLVAACADCNGGKSATPPDAAIVADVAQDDLRWARAIKRASAEIDEGLREHQELREAWDVIWNSWVDELARHDARRPHDWFDSIHRFINAGLSVDAIEEAMRMAMVKPGLRGDGRWRYFCGVCWNKVRQIRDVAKEIIAEDEAADIAGGAA